MCHAKSTTASGLFTWNLSHYPTKFWGFPHQHLPPIWFKSSSFSHIPTSRWGKLPNSTCNPSPPSSPRSTTRADIIVTLPRLSLWPNSDALGLVLVVDGSIQLFGNFLWCLTRCRCWLLREQQRLTNWSNTHRYIHHYNNLQSCALESVLVALFA